MSRVTEEFNRDFATSFMDYASNAPAVSNDCRWLKGELCESTGFNNHSCVYLLGSVFGNKIDVTFYCTEIINNHIVIIHFDVYNNTGKCSEDFVKFTLGDMCFKRNEVYLLIRNKVAFLYEQSKKAYKKFEPVDIDKLKACGSCANAGIYETVLENYQQVFWDEKCPTRIARVKFNNKSGHIEWVVYNDGKLVNTGKRESFTLETYEVLFKTLRDYVCFGFPLDEEAIKQSFIV